MGEIFSTKLSLVRKLLVPFRVAEECSSSLDFSRSLFSVLFVAPFLFISTKHVEIAFIAAYFSNINFYKCSLYILEQFKSTNKRSHSASTMFLVAKRPLFSATPVNGGSILTSIPGGITPVAKRMPTSVLGHALSAFTSSSRKTRASRPRALQQLWDLLKPLPRPR